MKVKDKEFFDHYRTRQFYQNQKNLLKEQTKERLRIGRDGGLFLITPDLINFVDLLVRKGNVAAVIVDEYDIPVMVNGLEDFLDDILDQYYTVMNDVHAEYSSIGEELDEIKKRIHILT